MVDERDDDAAFVIVNLVDHSVATHADAIEIVAAFQLSTLRWSRIRGKPGDRLENSSNSPLRYATKVLSYRRPEVNLKSCRRLQVA